MASKILVADDDELLRALMEHKLAAAGHRVVVAADGAAALALAAREQPDIIVLDAMMPERDGFEVLQVLKQDAHLRATPVVMLTSRKGENDIIGALRSGAAEYITKPFMPEELLTRIDRLLAAKGAA
jgi:DNA-binding response OmpR family regulator